MAGGAAVAPVDHGGQCGALARAGGAHHQNESAFFQNHVTQYRGQAQDVQVRDVLGDETDHHGKSATLAHGADAKPPHASHGNAHVQFAGFFQLFDPGRRHHLGQQAARRIGRQYLVVDGHAFTIDADQCWGIGRQVNV